MKIAVIAPSQIPSSTANSIQAMKVCQALAQLGNAVKLWVPGATPTHWPELSATYGLETPFEIGWLPSNLAWRRYDFTWKALKEANQWGAVLIYTWMLQVGTIALWQRKPVVLELHMPPSGRIGPRLFRQFIKSSGKKRLLLITEALRTLLEEEYQAALHVKEVQIAPMGSEPERYDKLSPHPNDARKALDLEEAPTVGYTGHFYPGRGTELLFNLAKEFPKVNFLWIGGRTEDVAYWQERLKTANIDNVLLTGFIDNRRLPTYQLAADILLMPYESIVGVSSTGDTASVCSPMKMFDYMSAGRAIISSDLPVLREVLHPGNAVFCPSDDINAWQKSLAELLKNETLRNKLANRAKEDARSYTWQSRAKRSISGLV